MPKDLFYVLINRVCMACKVMDSNVITAEFAKLQTTGSWNAQAPFWRGGKGSKLRGGEDPLALPAAPYLLNDYIVCTHS